MARKAKKLQELKGIFEENEIDFELFDDAIILKELRERLGIITDTRHESYIKHKLLDVIMITLLAVLANANEWLEVECFAKKKEKWLRKFLELPNGIPSDDTIRIVNSSLNPNYLYNIVLDFLIGKVDGIINTFSNENNNDIKDIMAIDGKTSCGSGRNETDSPKKKALHTLNIYSSNYGMCMGQVFIDKVNHEVREGDLGHEKSNEIPAAIDLLDIVDVKGTIVTWDALNTQKDTVKKVISKKGDYVGALKGNQHNFYEDVKDYFDDETIKELKHNSENYKKTVEKEHSGVVTREYFLTSDIKWLYNKEKWSGLKAIGLEKKTIQKNTGKVTVEQRFFIASFTDINNFEKAVREHWGVENGLHWHLDFTFKDDKNTTMAKTGAKNLQIFKKIALALLKIVQTLYNCSLKLIRYRLSLSFDEEIEKIFKIAQATLSYPMDNSPCAKC